MRRLHNDQGAALIMMIAVIAVLAVLGATLVMVTANAQHGTSEDRTKSKSFNVAEAGIDGALYDLSAVWPATSAQAATVGSAAIRSQFQGGADSYPDPPSGAANFVRVWVYDNSDTNGDNVIDTRDASYDAYADGRMFVEAQAMVGSQKSRVVTEVQVATTTLNFITGTAIYTGGDLVMDGVNKNKWAVGVFPGAPTGTQGNIISGGTIQPAKKSDYLGPNIFTEEHSTKTLYDVFPQATIDSLMLKAKTTKALPYRYYTTAAAAEGDSSPFAGVVVVDPPVNTFATVDLTTNSTSPDSPGLLLVTRGDVINIGNNAKYYGLVVVLDTPTKSGKKVSFDLGGNGNIQGMVFVAGDAKLHGDDKCWYDPNVANLLQNQNIYLKVRQVPNTWGEIRPQ